MRNQSEEEDDVEYEDEEIEDVNDDDDDDNDNNEDDENEDDHQESNVNRHIQQHRNRSNQGMRPLSTVVGANTFGFPAGVPPIMGESMCAQISAPPPSQVTHPNANALKRLGSPFVAQSGTTSAPVGPNTLGTFRQEGAPISAHGIINGPTNIDPTPFDPRGSNRGQVTSSYGIQNEIPRPLNNIPPWQTPVTPFSKARDTGPYDVGRSPFGLYNLQGYGNDPDAWRPKREQGPMFTPQPQNIYGMPAQAQVQRDYYQPSNELRHQKPFEAEWSLRTGGFHPTTRILPTFTPVMRQQLEQKYVAGPSFATSHPSGLYGQERGELGLVERRGADLSFYYRVPFPTAFVTDAPTMRSKIIDRPTSRQCTTRAYEGGANAAGTLGGAIYLPGKYLLHEQRLPSQEWERLQQAGAPHLVDGGATQSHFIDQARATTKEMTEMKTSVSNLSAPVPSGMVPFQDLARPTLLEGTEMSVQRPIIAGGHVGPTAHYMDQARPTMLEGTEMAVRQANGQWSLAPTMHFMDQAKPTMLEATEMAVRQANGQWSLAPTMHFMDQAKPTMLEATEMAVRQANGQWSLAPTMQFMDQARPTMLEATEMAVRQANGQWALAPTMQFMDQARTTMLEATEMAGPNSVGNVATQLSAAQMYNMQPARTTMQEATEMAGPNSVTNVQGASQAAMTYNMDPARPTLKQFTSDHDYTGIAGQSGNEAAMSTYAYTQNAVLNNKLEIANSSFRAPNQGPMGMVGTNADRVGYGDPTTTRLKQEMMAGNNYIGLPNVVAPGCMDRWIPQTTVNERRAFTDEWINERNSPFVVQQLQQNPFAIPMIAQTGNPTLPPQIAGANPGNCNYLTGNYMC